MADVFVSYKREDRALAAEIVGKLEATGYSVWWDDRLTPVESWDQLVEREISSAKAVLVLWTSRSAASQWVRNEADFAKDHRKLVPARLEACALPLAFRLIQTADLCDWDGDQHHLEWTKALGWIENLAGPPASVAAIRLAEQQARESAVAEIQAENLLLAQELEKLREENRKLRFDLASVRGDGENSAPAVPTLSTSSPEPPAPAPAFTNAPVGRVEIPDSLSGERGVPRARKLRSPATLRANAERERRRLEALRRARPWLIALDASLFLVLLLVCVPALGEILSLAFPSFGQWLGGSMPSKIMLTWQSIIVTGDDWFALSYPELALVLLLVGTTYATYQIAVEADTYVESLFWWGPRESLIPIAWVIGVGIPVAWLVPSLAAVVIGTIVLGFALFMAASQKTPSARIRQSASVVGLVLAVSLVLVSTVPR